MRFFHFPKYFTFPVMAQREETNDILESHTKDFGESESLTHYCLTSRSHDEDFDQSHDE